MVVDKIKFFFNDVSKEMKKVTWPTRDQLRESTIVVAVTCLLISAFVFLVDISMNGLMKIIYTKF